MTDPRDINKKLVEEAAEWIVLLSTDDEVARINAQSDFKTWKSISPQHYKIAEDIQNNLAVIQTLSQSQPHQRASQAAIHARLNSVNAQKYKNYGGVLGLIFFAGVLTYFWNNPMSYLMADIQNERNTWTTKILADGSTLILRGKSAVNLNYSKSQREIQLVQGEIYVDVAKDSTRPFIVKTSHGQIQALGTAFSVQYNPDVTELKMLHSRVKVEVEAENYKAILGQSTAIINAGEQVKIDQNGIQKTQQLNIFNEQEKWEKQHLIVENMPLEDVLAQLNQNYTGTIIYNSSALRQIQVSAVLPLDQTDHALKLLTTAFPELQVYQFSPYVKVVTLK